MSEKLLKTEEKIGRDEAAEKIHSLADRIAEGRVELKSGGDSLTLQPGDQVEFEIEVEREKDGDTSIEIEVEWPEEGKGGEIEIE